MRILIIKLSSMGDVLHTLPALTDCLAYFPQLKFDWVVEPAFKDILTCHPGVQQVYAFPLRAARKNLKLFLTEIPAVLKQIRKQKYDLVIDAQGLMKSAVLAKLVKGHRIVGLDKNSCREPLASKFYDKGYSISWSSHAVMRLKHLFSDIFGYPMPSEINYGIDSQKLIKPDVFINLNKNKYIILLHGTTWKTKHWPENYWQALIQLISIKYPSLKILLPWGSADELARANHLAKASAQAQVLPKLSIIEIAYFLGQAELAVAVDTGLGHLAAALGTKTINLYGPTDPARTGTRGLNQIHLAVNQINPQAYACSPCLKRHCIYSKPESQVSPPCYEIIHPKTVMERLSV